MAALLDVGVGTPIGGISWFNSDGTVVFPEVLVLEAIPGSPPNLQETGLVLFAAEAAELSWGQLDFGAPVTSTTGSIWVVFVLPPESFITGPGAGGGPGIGIGQNEEWAPIQISSDGLRWVQFDPAYGLAVQPVISAARGTSMTLAELKSHRPEGWAAPGGSAVKVAPLRTANLGAFPNPFNPSTVFRFQLASNAKVTLRVYNVRGRLVRTLVNGKMDAGEYGIPWDGTDEKERGVASGVYYSRLTVGGESFSKSAVLIK